MVVSLSLLFLGSISSIKNTPKGSEIPIMIMTNWFGNNFLKNINIAPITINQRIRKVPHPIPNIKPSYSPTSIDCALAVDRSIERK